MAPLDLPQELLQFLPSDPFQQLDFAHKITSIALATRISDLESELLVLRDELRKDVIVADLQDQIESLNVSLSNVLDELSRVDHEKEILLKENVLLSKEAKILNSHLAKLEGVKKTLMTSLQDQKGSSANDRRVAAPTKPNHTSISSQAFARENDERAIPSTVSPIKTSRPRVSLRALLASETSAPQLTPPGSPPSALAFRSPTRTSTSVSPRRLSVSFATTRSISDDRSSASSSATSSPYGAILGQIRVDSKEFFTQVRRRLSCDQFSAFLANVKNLNSHKQTKESLRYNRTSRACISQERNHGMPTVKNDMVFDDLQVSDNRKHPPLVSALEASAKQKVASFHFPGHNRGRAAPSSLTRLIGVEPFLHDLPELPELDNLFAPEGPILDAQQKAAKLFGAKETWFLVGGTTCGIQASIMATCSPGDTLILPRNSHISAFSSMVLSGVIPKYVIPEYDFDWDIACGITPLQIKNAINELDTEGRKASAVLITSPTYHGICSNLEEISQLCHSHNIPIIVDEAHGAHLGFHQHLPLSGLSQGVDLSVQSTHKVLCSLTQSSMLHMSGKIVNRDRICQCLQTLQSTSPSYLLLASLDAARAQISENPKTIFNKPIEIAMEARSLIEKIPGISVFNSSSFRIDPLRITVGVWNLGISGFEADDILYKDYGVVSELTGTRSITFALNLGTSRDDVLRLVSGLKHLSQTHNFSIRNKERLNDVNMRSFIGTTSGMRLSPREAFFASKKKVSFEDSNGKICGELVCPYPPGVPLLIPGEVITEEVLSYLVKVKNNGVFISGAADSTLSSIVVCS